jgi:hypothetical protein
LDISCSSGGVFLLRSSWYAVVGIALRGISCLPLELMEPTRKGIAVILSFGAPVASWQAMREVIASYATPAAEIMRR